MVTEEESGISPDPKCNCGSQTLWGGICAVSTFVAIIMVGGSIYNVMEMGGCEYLLTCICTQLPAKAWQPVVARTASVVALAKVTTSKPIPIITPCWWLGPALVWFGQDPLHAF